MPEAGSLSRGYTASLTLSSALALAAISIPLVVSCAGQNDESDAKSTPAQNGRSLRRISEFTVPLAGQPADHEVRILRGRDGLELRVAKRGARAAIIYDSKGSEIRREPRLEKDKIERSDDSLRFPDGHMDMLPEGHWASISPNREYAFVFPGPEVPIKQEHFIRLYDSRGRALWEYSNTLCPYPLSRPSRGEDLSKYWSPEGDSLAILLPYTSPAEVCVFSKKGFEWNYRPKDGKPVDVILAKGGLKVGLAIARRAKITLEERVAIHAEVLRRGLRGYSRSRPTTFYCFDRRGRLLWKRNLRPRHMYFAADGEVLLNFDRTPERKMEFQLVDANTGSLIHKQTLDDWDGSHKRKVSGVALDTTKKHLALLVRDWSAEGLEEVPLMGGTSYRETGPYKRHDLGFRLLTYDLSEVFPGSSGNPLNPTESVSPEP